VFKQPFCLLHYLICYLNPIFRQHLLCLWCYFLPSICQIGSLCILHITFIRYDLRLIGHTLTYFIITKLAATACILCMIYIFYCRLQRIFQHIIHRILRQIRCNCCPVHNIGNFFYVCLRHR